MKIFLIILIALVTDGCASNKGLIDLKQFDADFKAIVILEDEPTRKSVLPVLTEWFADNGFSATVVGSLSELNPDYYVFLYRAWWSWDFAIFMKKVEMKVRSKGETLGSLNFDALQYGINGKFGNAEERLKILLDVLFGKITREEADELLGEA